MKNVTIIFLVILGTFAYTSANFSGFQISPSADTTNVQEPLANVFSRWLVDTISVKITEISRFFNLKIRIVKFLASLYTNDNLVLLRNLTEYLIKFGNLTLRVLPKSVEDPGYWLISRVVKFLNNIQVGSGSIFDQFLAPIIEAQVNTADLNASQSENVELSITNPPPVYFNAPASQQQTYREIKAASYDEEETTDKKASVKDNFNENETHANQELLSTYEERIMALDKLINIKRK